MEAEEAAVDGQEVAAEGDAVPDAGLQEVQAGVWIYGNAAFLEDGHYAAEDVGMRAGAVHAMGRSLDSRWLGTVIDELASDDASIAQLIADEGQDCLCLAVTDAPLRLTGLFGRLLNPFIRF